MYAIKIIQETVSTDTALSTYHGYVSSEFSHNSSRMQVQTTYYFGEILLKLKRHIMYKRSALEQYAGYTLWIGSD